MPKLIAPTVGRRLWYWPGGHDHALMRNNDDKQPCDAGVVYVHSDRMVNLDVCDHNGNHHARKSVRLLQEDDVAGDDEPHCRWMDHQKGVADKAAAT